MGQKRSPEQNQNDHNRLDVCCHTKQKGKRWKISSQSEVAQLQTYVRKTVQYFTIRLEKALTKFPSIKSILDLYFLLLFRLVGYVCMYLISNISTLQLESKQETWMFWGIQ